MNPIVMIDINRRRPIRSAMAPINMTLAARKRSKSRLPTLTFKPSYLGFVQPSVTLVTIRPGQKSPNRLVRRRAIPPAERAPDYCERLPLLVPRVTGYRFTAVLPYCVAKLSRCGCSSARKCAVVDVEADPIDVSGGISAQPNDGLRDFVWLGEPTGMDRCFDRRLTRLRD